MVGVVGVRGSFIERLVGVWGTLSLPDEVKDESFWLAGKDGSPLGDEVTPRGEEVSPRGEDGVEEWAGADCRRREGGTRLTEGGRSCRRRSRQVTKC